MQPSVSSCATGRSRATPASDRSRFTSARPLSCRRQFAEVHETGPSSVSAGLTSARGSLQRGASRALPVHSESPRACCGWMLNLVKHPKERRDDDSLAVDQSDQDRPKTVCAADRRPKSSQRRTVGGLSHRSLCSSAWSIQQPGQRAPRAPEGKSGSGSSHRSSRPWGSRRGGPPGSVTGPISQALAASRVVAVSEPEDQRPRARLLLAYDRRIRRTHHAKSRSEPLAIAQTSSLQGRHQWQ